MCEFEEKVDATDEGFADTSNGLKREDGEMEGFESISKCLLLVDDSSIEVVRGLLFGTEYISESMAHEIISVDLDVASDSSINGMYTFPELEDSLS